MGCTIHKFADVKAKQIGDQTVIWQYNVIMEGAILGKNCNINCHCFIENGVVIGDNVTIKCGVYLWKGLILEDDVFIGPNVTFVNDKNPRSKNYPEQYQRTIIKKGATIGAATCVISGLTIGPYTMVGAGSMLTKNTNSYSLWYGHPAQHMGYVTRKGEVLNLDMESRSGEKYQLINDELIMI